MQSAGFGSCPYSVAWKEHIPFFPSKIFCPLSVCACALQSPAGDVARCLEDEPFNALLAFLPPQFLANH